MASVARHSVSRFEDTNLPSDPMSSNNVDKVVQSVTNATKRLSQISTSTNTSSKKRKSQNKIGPWKLGRTLGRGSTGRVRLAKNIETGQLAAIKIVPKSNFKKLENPKYKHKPESGDEDDAVQRLPYGIEREIIIMKLMSHPNIMALYDVWENKNDLYLILEYIEGGELFDYLIKKGKLQEYEAVNYFKQIINGINYLHQFNICHRDLKPENLLLDFNKNIKIADFGMAALEVNERLLETSCGSPHYASPEIVAGKNYHGAPSDIWSCGIILFALLTGHLPFDDENIRKLLLKVQSGKFVMPHELSWEAKDLITKMLRVNPLDRIEIESILKHPLLTKYPEPATSYSSTTTLDIRSMNIKPIQSIEQIDKEILTNLSVLFHNCDKRTIISRLTSPGKNPEKMFYYLLMKYRNDHIAKVGAAETTPPKATKSIPRSTSIVHTIIFDDATGEPINESTNVEQVTKSSSIYENKSLLKSKSSRHVLGNVTNTKGSGSGAKQFKASTSFNRKVSATHKHNQFSKSRNASSRSLRSNASRGTNTPTPPKSNSPSEGAPKRPQQLPPTLDEAEIPQRSPNRAMRQTKLTRNKQDNQSILKFETILDEVFNDTQDKENEVPSRTSSQRKREGALARKERELAEKVHQRNEARESRLRKEEQARRQLEEEQKRLAEQQKKHEEERRALVEKQKLEEKQSLEEKQKQAIARLKKHESGSDFAGLMKSNRNSGVSPPPPPPIKSSLDPRNSVGRARTLGPVPSKATLRTSSSPHVNENTSKVLHKFGIDVAPSPKKFTSDFKTSSSRNLSALLSPSPSQNIHKSVKTSSSRNLAQYLQGENESVQGKKLTVDTFNEIEHEKATQPQSKSAFNRRQSTQSSYYKSMLNDIDEDKSQGHVKRTPAPSIKEEDLNSSRISLIPNPRFSRFSFGGLLEPKTVTNEEGDITILSHTLNNSSTVVRRSNKSASTFAGLGIKVRDTIKEDDEEEEQREDNFVSVNTTAIDEGDRSGREEGDYSFDDSHSDATTVDSNYSYVAPQEDNTAGYLDADLSNFDVISSRTADIGKVTNQKPSIVDSKETLIGQRRVSNDETIRADDDNDDDLRSSFRARVNDEFDENDDYSLAEDTNEENQQDGEEEGEPAFQSDFKRSRHSTGIFSTAQLPRSPHVQLADNTGDDEAGPVRKKSMLKEHVITSPVQDTYGGENKQPLFRRFSTKAKRDAPTVPVLESTQEQEQAQSKGHNRFSRISVGSRNLFDMHNKPPQKPQQPQQSTGKSNWFKKFFQSLTSSSKQSKSSSGTEANLNRLTNRDIKIVESSLKSTDLIRLIKDQMELKELDGSVNNVGIDEEFGLITGTIPKKFAHGKKLKFRIEVVDLITSSSLHLMRMSGNEKGFDNLVKIVTYIIKKEEQHRNSRN